MNQLPDLQPSRPLSRPLALLREDIPVRFRVALLAGALSTLTACSTKPTEAPPPTLAPIAVTTVQVTQADWPATFEAGGIVRARVSTNVAGRLLATVTAVHVRVGDRVRAGAPLITLDARELAANQSRATAGVDAAQHAALAAAADESAAEANLTLARLTHDRIAGLAAKQSATPQELDQAVAALAGADAQLKAAKARRAAADASREAARAGAAAADTGASYAQITAPFDALVTERLVEPGVTATPGTPLLVLEDPASRRLEVRVDESRASWVEMGREVEVSLDPPRDSQRAWSQAKVAELDRLDAASHTFNVKIDLPAALVARSGSVGRARFNGPVRSALSVPDTALVRRGQLTFVFAIDGAGSARLRAVSPGESGRGRTEILAGLAAGDVVVVNAPPTLRDGQPVHTAAATPGGRP